MFDCNLLIQNKDGTSHLISKNGGSSVSPDESAERIPLLNWRESTLTAATNNGDSEIEKIKNIKNSCDFVFLFYLTKAIIARIHSLKINNLKFIDSFVATTMSSFEKLFIVNT